MAKFTKELAKLFRKITNSEIDAEGNAHVVLSPADSLLINNARIALASLEAEAVACIDRANLDYLESGADADVWPASGAGSDDVLLYAAPQLPQPAVLSVPDEIPKLKDGSGFKYLKDGVRYSVNYANGWNQCRAAMLQGAEPVTTAYKFPEETGSLLQLRNIIRQRHAEWSQATFGDVGPVGPLKHLSKEALEAAAEPDDLSEWADMQFLLWDAQRRAGISDGEITAAMEEKLKVNMARQWPEPKDGESRQHLKPAPQTVPDSVISAAVNGIMATYADNAEDCREMVRTHVEQACRAAIQESGHG